MNSNNVVFNKSQDVVFSKKANLGIKEIKDSAKKKFIMASIQMCNKAMVPV